MRTPNEVAGERLRTLREARGLSTRALAERVRALGVTIQHTGVTRREKAKTPLSPSELFAFAYALDTSPLDLLVPADDDERGVAVTPEVTVEKTGNLRRWIRGDLPLRGQDGSRYYNLGSLPSLEDAALFYNANSAHQRLIAKAEEVREAQRRRDGDDLTRGLRELEDALREVRQSAEYVVDRFLLGDES